MVGRYPVLFIILTLVVTGACCSGVAMLVIVINILQHCFTKCRVNIITLFCILNRDFGTKSESKDVVDLPKEVWVHKSLAASDYTSKKDWNFIVISSQPHKSFQLWLDRLWSRRNGWRSISPPPRSSFLGYLVYPLFTSYWKYIACGCKLFVSFCCWQRKI